MHTGTEYAEKRKKAVVRTVIIVLLLLLTALAVFIAVRLAVLPDSNSGGLLLDPGASDIEDGGGQAVGGIKIPGYDSVVFPAGEKHVQLTLINPEGNDCLFVYELYIEGIEEPVYTSGLIEPGKAVREIDLLVSLEAGEYTMNMRVNTYSLEERTPLNGALVTVPLMVY